MDSGGVVARLRVAIVGALCTIAVVLVAAPFLWLAGTLDGIEWHDDFIGAVIVSVLIYMAIAVGFVSARWRVLLPVWAIAVVWVLIEQLRWHDDPVLSGMNDLAPSFLLPFTPLVMLLPAVGVGLHHVVAWARSVLAGPSIR